MKQDLPKGWDEEKLRRIAEYYDREATGEVVIRRPLRRSREYALVEVPKAILPELRRLLAEYEDKRDEL